MRRSGSWTPVFDYMLALLGIFLIIAITEKPKTTPMRIETLGQYAVNIRWTENSDDDVDLYVQNPQGQIAFFSALTIGNMKLAGDDLGCYSGTAYGSEGNCKNGERILITQALPGEYIANVHMYQKAEPGPTEVTCELWRLRGDDHVLISKKIVLVRQGQEVTCFRWTLNRAGDASNFNNLPKQFIGRVL